MTETSRSTSEPANLFGSRLEPAPQGVCFSQDEIPPVCELGMVQSELCLPGTNRLMTADYEG